MKITFKLDTVEVKDIIKKHILKEFPVDISNKNIYISENYGTFTVEIEEKLEPMEENTPIPGADTEE